MPHHSSSPGSSSSTVTVSGNVTVVQPTAANLKVDASGVAVPVTDNGGSLTVDNNGTFAVQASGTVTANAGTNLNTSALALDATVSTSQPRKIQDSSGGSITLGQKAMATSLPVVLASDQPAFAINKTTRSDVYTGTANGTTVDLSANPLSRYAIQVKSSGGVASVWDIRLEGSLDNANFSQILQHTNSTGDGAVVWSGSLSTPSLYVRSRCASITLGLATSISATILGVS